MHVLGPEDRILGTGRGEDDGIGQGKAGLQGERRHRESLRGLDDGREVAAVGAVAKILKPRRGVDDVHRRSSSSRSKVVSRPVSRPRAPQPGGQAGLDVLTIDDGLHLLARHEPQALADRLRDHNLELRRNGHSCRTSRNSPPRTPNNSPPGLVRFFYALRTSLLKLAALSRPPPRPVALALHVHVVGAVHEPVEHALGDHRVGEELVPVLR